jgi:general stress protein YciG
VTFIPAARVGVRERSGAARGGEHSGGGFRVDAEPVGAYVIKDGEVEWQPVSEVCGAVGVSRATLYRYPKPDETPRGCPIGQMRAGMNTAEHRERAEPVGKWGCKVSCTEPTPP